MVMLPLEQSDQILLFFATEMNMAQLVMASNEGR